MLTAIRRFFAWIGSLMRRRHFIASTVTAISPPPPPPPPPPPGGSLGFPVGGLLLTITKAA